jgi:TPR repeat protein
MTLFGKGCEKDSAAAYTLLAAAAKGGSVSAQQRLGSMLVQGVGCTQDEHAAAVWWQQAADGGSTVAQYGLGVMLYHGKRGFSVDKARALGLWEAGCC